MATVLFSDRTTLRSLSFAIKIPTTSLWRLLKSEHILRYSSTLKPVLTEKNKEAQMNFSRSFADENGIFMDMMDYVHIDQKWFFMTKIKENYYLLPNETQPERMTKSKRFITKVMFMAAVARPRFDFTKKHLFDGKIGIWPFVYQEAAKQNSKNRTKGTMKKNCYVYHKGCCLADATGQSNSGHQKQMAHRKTELPYSHSAGQCQATLCN